MNDSPPDSVLLAQIGAAHGIRGEVRIKPFGDADMLDRYGPLYDAQGRSYEITAMRPQKTVLVVRFRGIDSREAAEALNGVELFVDRSALPAPEEDEFYLSDLIGLQTVSPEGEMLGKVVEVHDFGAGDILEIRLANGKSELFAFTRENFPDIRIAQGEITFVPPQTVSEREEK
ncbi:MAG: ribosome maturation factor RimM [Phyllobacteriaceae bacterium]|nr:ribosome maturation factor RimM [Phyllobacteriaceae bacterium]